MFQIIVKIVWPFLIVLVVVWFWRLVQFTLHCVWYEKAFFHQPLPNSNWCVLAERGNLYIDVLSFNSRTLQIFIFLHFLTKGAAHMCMRVRACVRVVSQVHMCLLLYNFSHLFGLPICVYSKRPRLSVGVCFVFWEQWIKQHIAVSQLQHCSWGGHCSWSAGGRVGGAGWLLLPQL